MLPAIAVIGMSCNFPGAEDYYQYWKNLCDGVVCYGSDEVTPNQGDWRTEKGQINAAETFDPARYNISEKEALLMDPQLRKFIEIVDDALLDANYPLGKGLSKVSVIAAQGTNHTYHNELTKLIAQGIVAAPETLLENVNKGADFLATRVAYLFDFTGPCFNLQSACSSSLTAAVEAVYMLQSGRCDCAITGGVNISYPLNEGYSYSSGSIHSKSGVCRPFDASADGIIPSNGGGVIVLKRLSDAQKAGDRIHGVINLAASNNDGNQKVSFAAPSVKGQYQLLKDIYQQAAINPTALKFIECHATGTVVGDPIEVRSLRQLMKDYIPQEQAEKVMLGSVKGNIGHLFWSSGIAAMIKAILSLKYGKYPGTANLGEVNPLLELEQSNMMVAPDVTHLTETSANTPVAYCGVSCMGVGGTNAHIILSRHGSHYLSDEAVLAAPALTNKRPKASKVFSLITELQLQPVESSQPVSNQSQQQGQSLQKLSYDVLLGAVIELYETSLGETGLDRDSDYFDNYGDSISAISLLSDIKRLYQVELTQEDIFSESTPDKLTRLIASQLTKRGVLEPSAQAQSQTQATVIDKPEVSANYSDRILAPSKGFNPFQSRFYLLEKLQRGGFSHYNVALCLKIDNDFPKAGFTQALELTLASIAQFNRQLKWTQDGLTLTEPRARLLQTAELEVSAEQSLESVLRPVFGHRFNLEKGCTGILTFVRQKASEYVVLNLPHLLIDGSGLDCLLRQTERLVNGGNGKVEKRFMSLDFQHQINPASREYWKQAIAGYEATRLSDLEHPPQHGADLFCGERQFTLDGELFGAIRQACREQQISPFVMLYAMFNYYLASHSEDKKICTGTTLANREDGLEDSIGCYINNIAVPVDCQQQTFDGVLARTKQSLQAGIEHANVPLDMVVSDSRRGGRPLYHILFMFQNQNRGYQVQLNGKTYQEANISYNPLYCDLCLNITPQGNGANLSITYNQGLYRQGFIEQLYQDFLATIGQCLGLLSASENAACKTV